MPIYQIIAMHDGRTRWELICSELLRLAALALDAGRGDDAMGLMRSASVAAWRAETV